MKDLGQRAQTRSKSTAAKGRGGRGDWGAAANGKGDVFLK